MIEKLNKLKLEWNSLNNEYKEIYVNGSSRTEELLVYKMEKIESTFRQLDLDVTKYKIENEKK